jgi:nucleotide-binding universal stress UspA family protein
MYNTILIPLENSVADESIIQHVLSLAELTGASLILMHVAHGWVARNYGHLNLAESEEMRTSLAYLQSVADSLRVKGFEVSYVLGLGEPSDEIVKFTRTHKVDLIVMAAHGHRPIHDLLCGSAADKVRHSVDVPVLLFRAKHNPHDKLPESPRRPSQIAEGVLDRANSPKFFE